MPEIASVPTRTDAFISYAREDRPFAVALQQALQRYKPARDLPVPQRYLTVFRDETDMTGVEYYGSITQHLALAEKLIVVCSPDARQSPYVNDEIDRFVSNSNAANVIPVLFRGIPNNEAGPEREHELAFPQALARHMTMPLATSFVGIDLKRDRVDKGRFEGAWHKLLADIYGVSRSELEQREKKRQARRTRWIVGVSTAISLVLAVATVVALYQRRIAIERGDVALSRQLAAQSQLHTADRLGLASLLAVEALNVSPTHEAHDRLLRIAQEHGNTEQVRSGNLGAIRQIRYSSDGAYLGAVDVAGHVMVWDRSGRAAGPRGDFEGAVPDAIAVRGDGAVAVARSGRGIELWEPAKNTRSALFERRDGRVTDLVFAHGGRWLAIVFLPHQLVWWDLARGQSISADFPDPHQALIDHLAASRDGGSAVSTDTNGNVAWWDCNGEAPVLRKIAGVGSRLAGVAFSLDGSTLVFARHDPRASIEVWQLTEGRFANDSVWNVAGHRAAVRSVSMTADQARLVSVDSDGRAIEWTRGPTGFSFTSARQLPDVRPVDYAVSPDATEIALGRTSGELLILKMTDRQPQFKEVEGYGESGPQPMGVDGAHVAALTTQGTAVVSEIGSGQTVASIEQAMGSELPFSWSGTGRLGAVDRTGAVHVWDSAKGLLPVLSGSGKMSAQYRIAMSHDGTRVATVGETGNIEVWEIQSRRRVAVPADYPSDARVLALSPDGNILATANEGGLVTFWSLDDNRSRGAIDLKPERIVSLTFSPEGTLLAVGGATGRVGILNVRDRSRYIDLETVHRGFVVAVAFSRNGRRMASGDESGGIQLWNVTDRTRLGSPLSSAARPIAGLGFSPDDKVLVSAAARTLRLWDVDPLSWQRAACALASRNLTCAEWREYLGDRRYEPHCVTPVAECRQ